MHTDPELLGLLALGEHVGTDTERIHTDTCPECSRELSELHRLAQLGRSVSPETTMATPSHDVWARIRAELDFDPALEPPTHRSLFLASDALEPPLESATPIEPPAPSPRRSLLAVLRAALAGTDADATADEPVVTADLSPVEAFWAHASGTAVLRLDDHGRRVLTVELQADLSTQHVRQAWLVSRDAVRRQTVGILDGRHGLWTVDHAVDLADFPILEISEQPLGADPGAAVLRGELVPSGRA